MVSFPQNYTERRERVQEAPGSVMADEAEASAYRGTAGKMWRWILRPFADRALKQVPFGGRILDLGTGPGLMPIYWARRRPDIEAVGVDLSPAMLALARAEAERAGVASRVRFMEADAADTGFAAGSFDVVACHYMLHHFDNPAAVLGEMQRLAGPGGAVLARDLVRPRPLLARLSVAFTKAFLRNTREQNQQYADSLAASHTADELRKGMVQAGLVGFEVSSGPVHVTIRQRPATARGAVLTHERLGRILAGATILASLLLAGLVTPWLLLIAAGTALNLLFSGMTDRCGLRNLLVRLGLPGERDMGRAEAMAKTVLQTRATPAGPAPRHALPETFRAGAAQPPLPASNRLSEVLARLESEEVSPAIPTNLDFADGLYRARVANDRKSREKAYRLVYRLYLEKEYVKPNPARMWLGVFDALPETLTLLVERTSDGEAVGALTVIFDSAAGLPADELYRPELDALRASGRKLSEIVSLGVTAGADQKVLVRLFNLVYIASRRVRGASDFIITVNPRHVRFYERTLLFTAAGPERACRKVEGAPAVLLRLDLAVPEERVRLEHGPAGLRPPKSRTLYPMFVPEKEEPAIARQLRADFRPMAADEMDFFMNRTEALGRATPGERARVASVLPGLRVDHASVG